MKLIFSRLQGQSICICFLGLMLLFGNVQAVDTSDRVAYTQASVSNLRADRTAHSAIVQKLPINTRVDILDKKADWVSVRVTGDKTYWGWLHQSLLAERPLSLEESLRQYESLPESDKSRLQWIERAAAIAPRNTSVLKELIKTLRFLGQYDRGGQVSKRVAVIEANQSAKDHSGAESIETAVYVERHGKKFALPVFSFPLVPGQIAFANRYEMENRMYGSRAMNGRGKNLVEDGRKITEYSPSVIYRHHGMRSFPETWFDTNGSSYAVKRGVQMEELGGFIGVEIADDVVKQGGRPPVLLVHPQIALPAKRLLGDDEWKQWPVLEDELASWAAATLEKCGSARESCEGAVGDITRIKQLQGDAVEYSLSNNKKIQVLTARSRLEGETVLNEALFQEDLVAFGVEHDDLVVKIWRLIDSNGEVSILRDEPAWAAGVSLVDNYCESQCLGGMENIEVISLGERMFVYATYWRGTVSGYTFFEIDASGFSQIGWYRWGS
jgi:hypothetical protein